MKRQRSNSFHTVIHPGFDQRRINPAGFHSDRKYGLRCTRIDTTDCVNTLVSCRQSHQVFSTQEKMETTTAEQLPFYGFFATTVFDRAIMSREECIVLASEMAMDFYSELSMLYDMTLELKDTNEGTRHMDGLVVILRTALQDSSVFPVTLETANTMALNIRRIYTGLIRVYLYLFQHYHRAFILLDVAELLSACWERLLAFSVEYKVLEDDVIQQAYNMILRITSATLRDSV
uniref:Uncharacterized protein AlNc14C132G6995 n=1 Tax=Albugo laibachii Nc14 TaxID=890382 RepID=F0WKE3_9STRA|nr:conserved hypothetical protein [Albugo laibachii Nc14]|eukprot:CCA21747.1 conserved hypothetical protein [Albugo laibachii Nc14]